MPFGRSTSREESSATPQATVLQARDRARRRGYPINVGLDYCASNLPGVDFVFFLDDDDIVYPFYTSTMASAFLAADADVIYAGSNRRIPGGSVELGYTPKPIYNLFRENFIPVNSYAMRHSALLRSGVRMCEEFEYTEDWHFLLRLLEAGLRFHALPTTLSEFRIASDGNLAKKRDPANWRATSLTIRQYINNSKFPIPGSDLARWTALASAPAVSTPDSLPVEAPRFRVDSDEVVVAALQRQIGALEDSLSWRCTAPLRYALGLLLRAGERWRA